MRPPIDPRRSVGWSSRRWVRRSQRLHNASHSPRRAFQASACRHADACVFEPSSAGIATGSPRCRSAIAPWPATSSSSSAATSGSSEAGRPVLPSAISAIWRAPPLAWVGRERQERLTDRSVLERLRRASNLPPVRPRARPRSRSARASSRDHAAAHPARDPPADARSLHLKAVHRRCPDAQDRWGPERAVTWRRATVRARLPP